MLRGGLEIYNKTHYYYLYYYYFSPSYFMLINLGLTVHSHILSILPWVKVPLLSIKSEPQIRALSWNSWCVCIMQCIPQW